MRRNNAIFDLSIFNRISKMLPKFLSLRTEKASKKYFSEKISNINKSTLLTGAVKTSIIPRIVCRSRV